jgi:acyl carrier protein
MTEARSTGTTQDQGSLDMLSGLLHARFEVPLELLTPDAEFGTLGLDSLSVEELQLMISDNYGFELWTGDYDPGTTLGQAAEALAAGHGL